MLNTRSLRLFSHVPWTSILKQTASCTDKTSRLYVHFLLIQGISLSIWHHSHSKTGLLWPEAPTGLPEKQLRQLIYLCGSGASSERLPSPALSSSFTNLSRCAGSLSRLQLVQTMPWLKPARSKWRSQFRSRHVHTAPRIGAQLRTQVINPAEWLGLKMKNTINPLSRNILWLKVVSN